MARILALLSLVMALGGCGSNGANSADGDAGPGGDGAPGIDGSVTVPDASMADLVVEPSTDQTLSVVAGQPLPTLTYSATLAGVPVAVAWSVDRGEIGSVASGPDSSTVFTPSGQTAGVLTLFAGLNGEVLERRILVTVETSQNGPGASAAEQAQIPGSVNDLTAGGGVGGVGGEGLGTTVDDAEILSALDAPTGDGSAQGLTLLYPYDGTVWPRGLSAPLLQWDWSIADADAIRIELETTSGSFSYAGTFGRPAILSQTGGNFIRHPVPQDAWTAATNSAGAAALDGTPEQLIVRLTVAQGGAAYGPIEQTYRVAPARLAGTIYYQSYGTNLAKNYTGAVGGDGMFGGAVLSIKVGDHAPQLAAGSSGGSANCRVCHSVSADGSRLVASTSAPATATYATAITPIDLTETSMANNTDFPGMTPDGAYALSATGQLLDLNNGGATSTATGLENISNLGTPAFSPSGDKVVFNAMGGDDIDNPSMSLSVMDFNQSTGAFSNLVEVLDNSALDAESRPGWAAFMPDGTSIVYQQQIAAGEDGNGHGDLRTRKGAKAHMAWTQVNGSGTPTPLDMANGTGYLPQLASPISLTCTGDGKQVGGIDADHADDENLNYEPTVNPIASGGYAWVVFTSRRMYGSVADIPPFCSDPRGVNLIENITPKKLWVAAVDLNADPGTDPSYPAFYLPAQELLAGNARGFWVLDPCRADGDSCETGDQCCNGFCSQVGDALECSSVPSNQCSMTQEACTTAADCCNPTDDCLNGFCASVIVVE